MIDFKEPLARTSLDFFDLLNDTFLNLGIIRFAEHILSHFDKFVKQFL